MQTIIEFPHHSISPEIRDPGESEIVDPDRFAFVEHEQLLDPADVIDLDDFRHPEEPLDPETESRVIRKAKGALTFWTPDGPVVMVLTRSQAEHTRRGGRDLAGGKLNPGESFLAGFRREVEDEELPGVRLGHIIELGEHSKLDDDGVHVLTKIYAATATLPESGVVLSSEHSDWSLPRYSQFPLLYLPDKYNTAITSDIGMAAIYGLSELVAPKRTPSRHDLSMINFLANQASAASMQYLRAA